MISHISLKNSFIEIFLFSEHLKNSFNENDKVHVKLIKDNLEYTIEGIVDNKALSAFDRALKVEINDTKIMQNLRKSERFTFNTSVQVKQENHNMESGVLKNISSEGVLFTSDKEFSESSSLAIEISAFPGKLVNCTGKIIRKSCVRGKFNYAVKIIEINNESREILNELIIFLTMQKNLITKEFKDFNKAKLEATMLQSRLKI